MFLQENVKYFRKCWKLFIILFPKTLGGGSFEKAGKLYEGEGTIFFDKMVPSPSYSLSFQKNDQRGIPLWKPQAYFCFLLLMFIFFTHFVIQYRWISVILKKFGRKKSLFLFLETGFSTYDKERFIKSLTQFRLFFN